MAAVHKLAAFSLWGIGELGGESYPRSPGASWPVRATYSV
jgi:hypothetical protein